MIGSVSHLVASNYKPVSSKPNPEPNQAILRYSRTKGASDFTFKNRETERGKIKG